MWSKRDEWYGTTGCCCCILPSRHWFSQCPCLVLTPIRVELMKLRAVGEFSSALMAETVELLLLLQRRPSPVITAGGGVATTRHRLRALTSSSPTYPLCAPTKPMERPLALPESAPFHHKDWLCSPRSTPASRLRCCSPSWPAAPLNYRAYARQAMSRTLLNG